MLTPKQSRLLEFLSQSMAHDGVCPSFDEMREAVGLKSKSGIHRLIQNLEERGYIRRLANRARAIEILKKPKLEKAAAALGQLLEIPMMGRIAAGSPIEAISNPSDNVLVDRGLLPSGELYALEIHGDSMVNDGIHNGDRVIIRRQNRAENGEIVVALVNGEEVTLKRYYPQGRNICLRAANPDYPDQVYDSGQVELQGKLVYLMRGY